MFGIELEVVVHVAVYHCHIIGCVARVAIATGLLTAYEFGQATVQCDEIDIEAVQACDEIVAPLRVFNDMITDHVVPRASQRMQTLVHACKDVRAHLRPAIVVGANEVHRERMAIEKQIKRKAYKWYWRNLLKCPY